MSSSPVEALPQEQVRHCAFCFKEIPGPNVLVCSKCHRRPYCSKNCQNKDWTTKVNKNSKDPVGQGHKNWCGIDYGEEDVDWKVVEIEGKGLGVIALKSFPSKSRIMVEGCQLSPSTTHPAFLDLMPQNGSREEKFKLNSMACGSRQECIPSALCIRMSRVNHACHPNAGHLYDIKFRVKVLFAEFDIEPGQEICINYVGENDLSGPMSMTQEIRRNILASKWGIKCSDSLCRCSDPDVQAKIQLGKELDEKIIQFSMMNPDKSVESAKRLMALHEEIGASWVNRSRTMYDLIQVSIVRRKTLNIAKEWIKPLYELHVALGHPESTDALAYKKLLDDVRGHSCYLLLE